ncbi:MAG: sn-glycerol-3-phosphate ABC transporter ATP-binding protein UgpC [Pseudomonadota bacterium]
MALDSTGLAALEARKLKKAYGEVEVLHDVNIEMGEGEFLVLVGPSGCGKSTLLNCIAGLEEITSGSLHIGGRDVTSEPPKDRDIAMVFQSYALYPTMTVGENIAFGMKIRKVPKLEMDAKVKDVATMLQIDHLLDRRPSQLSGGQRQRVAMGRALVRDPKLFLFDEPLSNLDAKLRVEMRAEIKRLHQRTDASIVYVTHDQIEAMTLATRIVVLKGGYIQQIGTPNEIYRKPANTFVADFMGSPPMNLVPGRIVEGILHVGAFTTAIERSDLDGEVIVGIRPEDFVAAGTADSIAVVPTLVEGTGPDTFVTFDWSDDHVTARLPGNLALSPSKTLQLSLDPAKLCFFDPASQTLL